MKYVSLLILLMCLSSIVKGQLQDNNANFNALKVCNEIKSSILLVKLEDYHNDIQAYESVGNTDYVKYLKKRAQKLENRLKEGFEKEYSFSKAAFFYAKDIDKVLNGELNEFLDLKGKSLIIDADEYPKYIASYSRDNYSIHTTDMIMHIHIRDNGRLEPIPKPFISSYANKSYFFRDFFTSHPKTKVRSMNDSLFDQLKKFEYIVNSR